MKLSRRLVPMKGTPGCFAVGRLRSARRWIPATLAPVVVTDRRFFCGLDVDKCSDSSASERDAVPVEGSPEPLMFFGAEGRGLRV